MRLPRVLRAVNAGKQSGDALGHAALFGYRRKGEASNQPMVHSRQQAAGYKLTVPGQSKQLLAVRPPRVPCAIYRGKQRGDALRLAALFG